MWTDNASKIDMLFYKPYAEIVSEIAIETDIDPLTIGILGLWGAGKSTLLNLIKQRYEEDGIICVMINAWMFESYEDAKSAIMEALLRELEERIPGEEAKKKFRTLLKKIDFFKLGTKVISSAVPAVASMDTGNPLPLLFSVPQNAKEIGTVIKNLSDSVQNIKDEYIKDDSTTSNSVVNNVRKFKDEFQEAISTDKIKRVVVLIDDLDRCQPERIIEILEVIKLFLSVNKTTFIIATDENVIQYAIKKKYPKVDNFDVELDKEYIEKMIQLPVHIPELSSKDIQNYLLLLVMQKYMKSDSFDVLIKKIEERKLMIGESAIDYEQIKGILNGESDIYKDGMKDECDDVAKVILQIRSIVAHTLKGNPRQAKRFLNTFITKRQLSKLYYGDELDMGVMAKLLTLHKLNPDLFNKLNEWNANFDTENEQFKRMRQSLDDENPEPEFAKWHKSRIKDWVQCPPVELEKKNLNKYFYLTREILKKQDDIESELSGESRKLLERIGKFNPGLADGIMRDMKELRSSDLEDVMKVLIKKIESGVIESNVYSLLFVNFSDYRGEIIEAIKRADKPLEAGDLPSFRAMYLEDKDAIENLLNELENVKQKIKDRIMKTGD